jgi:putative transposase
LRILGIPRSTYYEFLRPKKKPMHPRRGKPPPGYCLSVEGRRVPDSVVLEALESYRADPFMRVEGGTKVLAKYLRRDLGLIVNHKKVARLCLESGLMLAKRRKKKSKFRVVSQNHQVSRPNQVWEFDLKYGYLHGEQRFFFLAAFVDVFTRETRGWYLGRRCTAQDLLSTLKFALKENSISEADHLTIRSDNGPQMRAKVFADAVEALPASHEFIPVRTPNKNAHIESFFSIYERHLNEQYFWSLRDAYQWTTEFMAFYNDFRIHGSLGMSPSEFGSRTDLHSRDQFRQAI